MVPKETNNVTILCIDDDPDVLNLLQKILTGAGYSVIVAGDGKKGNRRSPQPAAGSDSDGRDDAGNRRLRGLF